MAGGGGGESTPISLSASTADQTNPVFGGDTEFILGSPYGSTGTNDQSARNTGTATATSAAAEGNLQQTAQSSASGAQTGPSNYASTASIPPLYLWIAAGGFVALLGILWVTRRPP